MSPEPFTRAVKSCGTDSVEEVFLTDAARRKVFKVGPVSRGSVVGERLSNEPPYLGAPILMPMLLDVGRQRFDPGLILGGCSVLGDEKLSMLRAASMSMVELMIGRMADYLKGNVRSFLNWRTNPSFGRSSKRYTA